MIKLFLNFFTLWLIIKIYIAKIENDVIPGAEYLNENDSEDTESNKTSAITNFIPKVWADDEIAESTNSCNLKEGEAFNVFHTWAKDYTKDKEHTFLYIYIHPLIFFRQWRHK